MRPDAPAQVLALTDVAFSWPGPSAFTVSVERFRVQAGEKLLLMGPSGGGKSTLLALICGILRPSHGSIVVAGTDIARLGGAACDRFRADHFGVIFQMFNLLPYGSVLDNVLLPLSFAPARRARVMAQGTASAEAARLLSRLELPEALFAQRAAALSVGQQQRVAVARALIGRPDIVIADEPTSALDQERRTAFLTLLFEEVSRAGATLIMVSHDAGLAPGFDRVEQLDRIVVGSPA